MARCWRCRLSSSLQHNAMTAATWSCIAHRIFLIGAEARIKVDLRVSIEMMNSNQICIKFMGVGRFHNPALGDQTTWTACPVAGWWGGLPPPLVSLCWVHVGFHRPGEGGMFVVSTPQHDFAWQRHRTHRTTTVDGATVWFLFLSLENQFEQGGGAIFIHFHMLPWESTHEADGFGELSL